MSVKSKRALFSGNSAGIVKAVGSPPEETVDALITVLDDVRLARSRSRSELVARTGLSRAVVAQRVEDLIGLGLVREGELGLSTGGRPPRQLAFRADAGHVLVADLGATSIDVALTSLDGRILAHRDEPADISDGPEAALTRVDELFAELRSTTRGLPLSGQGRPAGQRLETADVSAAADDFRIVDHLDVTNITGRSLRPAV
jgi:hypothetical protein